MLTYTLITPAHNEEKFLERTIQSVLAQNYKPLRWVIVDDGSSDRTAAIAQTYSAKADFIRTITIHRDGARAFSNKARAFGRGVELLSGMDYDCIGNLDADIEVDPSYFRNMVQSFEHDAKLGITGGMVFTKVGDRFVSGDRTLDSVGGAVQLFRRACFEDVGGYLPLPHGGIDSAAEIIARMKGWEVRKSLEHKAFENRLTGSATATPLKAGYRLGQRFHSIGYGFWFFSLRCLYRVADKPVFLGSCATFLGFLDSVLRRRPVVLPDPVVQYLRSEQREKLRRILIPRTTTRSLPKNSERLV
jgi:glycosyltransferase involved in cell wall biosynthesis